MKKKNRPMITTEKKVKQIREYYYMSPSQMEAKEMSLCIETVPQEQIEVWRELNLMEVVLDSDSLIFQDAGECFIDPLDLEFIQEHQIRTIYQISFEAGDGKMVRKIMRELIEKKGGFICSDTETFEPIYGLENMEELGI